MFPLHDQYLKLWVISLPDKFNLGALSMILLTKISEFFVRQSEESKQNFFLKMALSNLFELNKRFNACMPFKKSGLNQNEQQLFSK